MSSANIRNMINLRDFIAQRRAEIGDQIGKLQQELADLDIAEAALSNGPQKAPSVEVVSKPFIAPNLVIARPLVRRGTIKAKVLAVLRAHESGDANDIREWIHSQFGEDVPRESLSPQLSRLKADGWLTLEGKNWKYIDATTNETPDAELSGVSKAGEGGALPNDSRDDDVFG